MASGAEALTEFGGDGNRVPFPSMHVVHWKDLTSLSETWLNPSNLSALLSRITTRTHGETLSLETSGSRPSCDVETNSRPTIDSGILNRPNPTIESRDRPNDNADIGAELPFEHLSRSKLGC